MHKSAGNTLFVHAAIQASMVLIPCSSPYTHMYAWLCAGFLSAPTTGPSSTNTANTNSITDMNSLPDILRARSAMLVGALELGAPLGRGSYGKVYKGARIEHPIAMYT